MSEDHTTPPLSELERVLNYYANGGGDPRIAANYLRSGGKVNDPPLYPPSYAALALATAVIPEWDTLPPMEVPRSGKWPRLAKIHLHLHPECAVCRAKLLCVPHHEKPVHLFPEHELDPDNLITLCPPHHLLFGHLMNWRAYNRTVRKDAQLWRQLIETRPLAATPERQLGASWDITKAVLQAEAKCDELFARHPVIV